MNLPKTFEEKMIKLLGDDSSKFFSSLESPSIKAITVNHSRITDEDFKNLCDFEIEKIEKIDNGYYVKDLKFSKNILSHLGVIYSQEPSAMYPVELLDVKKGEIVLDVCSSPGGKSIQILEKLNGTGFLLSNEIIYNRCKILYENLNRMGFKNFAISCNSSEELKDSNIMFDKILVDAPCGGEGMFRKEGFDYNAYSPESIVSNSKRQLAILNNVKGLLKKGGRLVYSTCTYDTRENEEVVLEFLNNNKDYKLIYIKGFEDVTAVGVSIDNSNTNYCYRRYPHLHRGEGQFMAVLEKTEGEELYNTNFSNNSYSKLSNKDKNIIYDNLSNVCDINNLNIVKKSDNYYTIPETNIALNNLNIVTIGCVIGSVNNKAFKINHNFYHTYGDLFYNKINLPKEVALKYLHGDEIETENKNGVCVICYKNIPLGGGKIVNGRIKNYYPKELRI